MANIKVYSTPTCPYCKMAKEFLKEQNVEFENIDISTNEQASKEIVDKSGQMGVPVILIDDKVIVGFNKEEILSALGK